MWISVFGVLNPPYKDTCITTFYIFYVYSRCFTWISKFYIFYIYFIYFIQFLSIPSKLILFVLLSNGITSHSLDVCSVRITLNTFLLYILTGRLQSHSLPSEMLFRLVVWAPHNTATASSTCFLTPCLDYYESLVTGLLPSQLVSSNLCPSCLRGQL